MDFNAIERSELLTHPTASRARAPKRRPPSGINVKEVNQSLVKKLLLLTGYFELFCTVFEFKAVN